MELLESIRKKSIDDNIAIVREKTLELLINTIKTHKYKTILEVGTGYGYSAFAMNQFAKVTTIEKDDSRYQVAYNFLKNTNVKLVHSDIFEWNTEDKYDMIFIDGPKSHQDILVNKFIKQLNTNGLIVIDNIYLKKFDNLSNLTKNQKALVSKVQEFRDWLTKQPFHTEIINIDDGVAIIHNL